MEKQTDTFLIFKKEGQRIIALLGLKDYEICFKKSEDITKSAFVDWIPGNHCFTVSFSPSYAKEFTIEEIKNAAIEEILHILFAHFWELAKAREFNEDELEYEEHRIIYRLINSGALK